MSVQKVDRGYEVVGLDHDEELASESEEISSERIVILNKKTRSPQSWTSLCKNVMIFILVGLLLFRSRESLQDNSSSQNVISTPTSASKQLSSINLSTVKEEFALPTLRKPIFAISAGLPRTGSTGLYNMIRHWVMLADPDAVYGWKYNPEEIEAIVTEKVTLLVKLHHPYAFGSVKPDVVFFSHRKPSDTHCSLKMMGFDKGESTCSFFKGIQHNLYRWYNEINSDGSVTMYDMDFRDWVSRPLEVIAEVGELLGVHPIREQDVAWIYDQVVNTNAFKFVGDMIPAHHPITLMHAHHRNAEQTREEMCGEVNGWVQKHCPEWEKREGEYKRDPKEKKDVKWAKWKPDIPNWMPEDIKSQLVARAGKAGGKKRPLAKPAAKSPPSSNELEDPQKLEMQIFSRCGTSWIYANSNCGKKCEDGDDDACPDGKQCFKDMTQACPSDLKRHERKTKAAQERQAKQQLKRKAAGDKK